MLKVNINLAERSYPIYISTDYSGIGRCLSSAHIAGKLVMVTDENVDGFQAQYCMEGLQSAGYSVEKYVIKPGEASKNLDTIREIYSFLLKHKLDRSSALIALGGGVVGDITGFAAATFLRGINFVQVPTSLLAQADSSVGGKVGVDFEGSKNIIGAFYQPRFVYINVNSLKTLPEREMRSGLAEVLKHGIIMDKDFFEYVEYNIPKILNFNEEVLQYVTKINCTIKGGVVQQDEKESGMRALLNFGHTFGHAIESVSNFSLLHGECVAIGMMGALKLAKLMEMADEAVIGKVEKALKKAGLPVKASGLDPEIVYSQLFRDKKVKADKLVFVLPKDIGDLYSLPVEDEEMIRTALAEIIE